MNRRQYLGLAWGTVVASHGVAGARSTRDQKAPPVAWKNTYDDLSVASIVQAHGGGYAVVNRGQSWPRPSSPIRIALIDETGVVRRRKELDPDISQDAGRARADIDRTTDGYVVATGTWFARLGEDLSVQRTGYAEGHVSNFTTYVTDRSPGTVVARDRTNPERQYTKVLGFGADGDLHWTWQYGKPEERGMTYLGFLLDHFDNGVVVGGTRLDSGEPWLASLTDDGTERWHATVTGVPSGVGTDATLDEDGFTLLGKSELVRLNRDRSVDWQRSYDGLGERASGQLIRTADGGYAVASIADWNEVAVVKTDPNGRRQWASRYVIADDTAPSYEVRDLVETGPGEYVVVGVTEPLNDETHWGWALLLSETNPTPVRTPSPTVSVTPTQSPTPTGSATPSASPTGTDTKTEADTVTTPGFGILSALVGLAAGWFVGRQ